MALAQSRSRGKSGRKQPTQVYALRVGPKKPGKTRYVVGFVYPPKPIGAAVGAFVDWCDPPPRRPRLVRPGDAPLGRPAIVVAPQALALIGPGPRVFGWPHCESGLSAARNIEGRIPGSKVVRVKDWRGNVM